MSREEWLLMGANIGYGGIAFLLTSRATFPMQLAFPRCATLATVTLIHRVFNSACLPVCFSSGIGSSIAVSPFAKRDA